MNIEHGTCSLCSRCCSFWVAVGQSSSRWTSGSRNAGCVAVNFQFVNNVTRKKSSSVLRKPYVEPMPKLKAWARMVRAQARSWQQQAELMMQNKAQAFTLSNLVACRWLRDRMGWRLSFQIRWWKGCFWQEGQRGSPRSPSRSEGRGKMVRQLLGRGDLIKLAALLHI